MKSKFLIIILAAAFSFTACIKNDLAEFDSNIVELDAASWNANAAGLTYPILTRQPANGRASGSSDSTIRRYAQTINLRINLLGSHSGQARTIGVSTFPSPITTVSMPATIAGQTPSAGTANLTVTDAVSGTHYTMPTSVTIPANSSFGILPVTILNPGPTAGAARFLGIKLTDTNDLKASVNYSMVGIIIDQR